LYGVLTADTRTMMISRQQSTPNPNAGAEQKGTAVDDLKS
jgi:hypothetical protein